MNDNNETVIKRDISFTFDEFILNKEEIIGSYAKFKIEKMWPNTDDSITYIVVNTDAEMTNELARLNRKVHERSIYYSLRLEGIIVNSPIKDLSNKFLLQIDNVIFLHDVTLSSSLKSKSGYENIQVIWNNCYFLNTFKIQTFDWNSLLFQSCKFYGKVFIANLKLNCFEMRSCTFYEYTSISSSRLGSMDLSYINAPILRLDSTRTQYDCKLETIIAEEINLRDSNISKNLSILNSNINEEYKLDLTNVSCENFTLRS